MATRATSRGPVPADRRRAAPRPGADSGPALTFPLTSHGPVLPDRRAVVGARQLMRTMQAAAGNLAVTIALQRAGGWPDAASQGPAWNDARPKQIGRVRRLAIAGLAGGATSAFKGGDSEHTAEGADRRAIVLVPQGFLSIGSGRRAALLPWPHRGLAGSVRRTAAAHVHADTGDQETD